jgi:GNAT superfamily N-acetyltransferase
MAADLHQMNEEILKQVPAGFVIHEVETEQDLLDFRSVLMAGYDMPDWAAQGWVDAALNIGIRKTPWKMYLGRLDGQPVASHILMNGGGVAGVFGIATIPSARGKGIGAAITLQPLLEAREMGYRYGVLFTSEMGKLVYERIGFRLVDCHINRYFWRNG